MGQGEYGGVIEDGGESADVSRTHSCVCGGGDRQKERFKPQLCVILRKEAKRRGKETINEKAVG